MSADAVPISGQINITGNITSADLGGVDFTNDVGTASAGTGDLVVLNGLTASLTDLSTGAAQTIWSITTAVGDIFSFAANTSTATDTTPMGAPFTSFLYQAVGTLSYVDNGGGLGLTDTLGTFVLTTNQFGQQIGSFSSTTVVPLPAAGWLFITALAGAGALARRRKAAA